MTTSNLSTLNGRIALVTGASRGIGAAVARTLAQQGADIIGVARDRRQLLEAGGLIEESGSKFLAIASDVGNHGAPAEICGEALAWQGHVDVLVNVAGTVVRKSVLDTTADDWDATFAVNVRGPFLLSQCIGKHMLEREYGVIVNVTSLAGSVTTTKGSISYATSKAALGHMTRILAAQWAPTVRVNAVAPGYLRTDLTEEWLSSQENLEFVLEHTAMGRLGAVDDVASLVSFLVSAAASHITGQEFHVNGGWGLK